MASEKLACNNLMDVRKDVQYATEQKQSLKNKTQKEQG